MVRGDGAHPGGAGRSGWRARPARPGRAPVRWCLFPECAPDRDAEGAGVGGPGPVGEALGWAREQGLSVDDELSYLHEFDHITLARVLMARYQSDRADGSISEVMGLLERLLKAAEEGGRKGSVIEILVLQALAYHVQGDLPAALVPLQHALALAEPEGYVRMFLDEGASMLQLLREASAREIMPRQGLPTYTDKLLAAFEAEKKEAWASRLSPIGKANRLPHCSP